MKDSPWLELERIQNFLDVPVELSEDSFKWSDERGLFCLNKDGIPNCLGKGKGRSNGWEFEPYLQKKLTKFFKPFGEKKEQPTFILFLDQHFANLLKKKFSWQDKDGEE